MTQNELKKIYITQRIPEIGIRFLTDLGYHVDIRPGEGLIQPAMLRKALKDYDGMISMLSDTLDAKILSHAVKCRVIAQYAVGVNNIDLNAAKDHEITVTNTPDVLTEATAELAMALVLGASRRLIPADRFTREGKFTGWGPLLFLGKGLDGKTVGVVGMGRIGQAFARMAAAFNCRVIFHSRTSQKTPYNQVDLDTLLRESDVISLHLPLTDSSRHMVDLECFNRMKDGVVFVNTARGPIVHEAALVKALKSGKVSYAGLDVYEFEPRIRKELLDMENVIVLPHIGSATEKARDDMALLAARNIHAVLSGKPAETSVT